MEAVETVLVRGDERPWNVVYRLGAANISQSWLLTGGLMVQLYATMAHLSVRPTHDADFLVDVIEYLGQEES